MLIDADNRCAMTVGASIDKKCANLLMLLLRA